MHLKEKEKEKDKRDHTRLYVEFVSYYTERKQTQAARPQRSLSRQLFQQSARLIMNLRKTTVEEAINSVEVVKAMAYTDEAEHGLIAVVVE